MRWIAGVALIVASLALGLQVWRPSGAQSPWQRYQVVADHESSIVRLDTNTGEMVAFKILPRGAWERDAKPLLKDYGNFEFIELARLASPQEPK